MATDELDLNEVLDKVLTVEGEYADNPDDSGGETIWGITIRTARQAGYYGPMIDMTKEQAKEIYIEHYIIVPNFDLVLQLNKEVGIELIDTGVNMGPAVAIQMLQRSLNALNRRQQLYTDIEVDGDLGVKTLARLRTYLQSREASGVTVLLRCLNSLQGAAYISLAERRQKDEAFVFGWFLNRVVI